MTAGELASLLIAALGVAFIGWAVVRFPSGRQMSPDLSPLVFIAAMIALACTLPDGPLPSILG
jgi:hypothetical protein